MKRYKKALSLLVAAVIAVGAAIPAAALPQFFGDSTVYTDSPFLNKLTQTLVDITNALFYPLLTHWAPLSCVDYEITQRDSIFEKGDIAGTRCHASTLLKLEGGVVLTAWFSGQDEGAPDSRIYTARYENGAWSTPLPIPNSAYLATAHWNPVLYQRLDGSIRCFFKVSATIEEWVAFYSDSFDGGLTWTEAAELRWTEADPVTTARGPAKNKLLRTSTGLLIAGGSYEPTIDGEEHYYCFMDISRDDGETWTMSNLIETPKGAQMLQPALWESADGSVHALFRNTAGGFMFRADSEDGGLTWGEAYRVWNLPNNYCGIDLAQSDNGWLWLVCNATPFTFVRAPLRVYVSRDDGNTWEFLTDLESCLVYEQSYPAIVADGNTLHITYTDRRERIRYAALAFDPM